MDGKSSPLSAAALFARVLREVPGVLDRLSNEDKTSLAAARWSTLEAVLRGSDATLKVHPEKPVLHVLARVLDGGECRGQIEHGGVVVPATDARALLAALDGGGVGVRGGIGYSRSWAAFVWRVLQAASTSGEGPLRVMGLRAPHFLCCGEGGDVAGVALGLRLVLEQPAVREHLRHLELPRLQAGTIDVLQGSLRGLTALRRLSVLGLPSERAASGALVQLVSECAALRRLELSDLQLRADNLRMLLDWAAGASELRELQLLYCKACLDNADEWWPPGAHPFGRLEVYDAQFCPRPAWLTQRAWWGLTNLRELILYELDFYKPGDAMALADLLRNSKKLEVVRLTCNKKGPVGDDPDADTYQEQVTGLLSALGMNKSVRQFRLESYNGDVDGFEVSEAVGNLLGCNRSLEHFELERFDDGNTESDFPGCEGVAGAAAANTSLERLALPGCGPDCDADALQEQLARNKSLRHLEFGAVRLSADGMKALGLGAARMASLQALEIGHCPDHVVELLKGLWSREHKCKLQRLRLQGCVVDRAAAEILADVLTSKHCTLRELDLRNNQLGDKGAKALARALRENATLVSLNVADNPASEAGVVALLQALHANQTLRVLTLNVAPIFSEVSQIRCTPAIGRELQHVRGRVRGLEAPVQWCQTLAPATQVVWGLQPSGT